jgi:predicted nucleic-acid-binding protein
VTGIDTNVLVRYLLGDDRRQAAASQRFFEEQLSRETPGYVSAVVLAETIWVLTTTYRVGRETVVEIVEGLLGEERLVLEHENDVFFALAEYRTGGLDFSDALIATIAASAGCHTTVTFDKQAARTKGFTLLQ